jgi:hypothetical protein
MATNCDFAEAVEVVVCPTVEPSDPTVYEVETEIRFFGNFHDLCGYGPGQEERNVRECRDVVAAKSAGVAAGPFAQLEGRAAFPWDAERAVALLADVWTEPVAAIREKLAANLRCLGMA